MLMVYCFIQHLPCDTLKLSWVSGWVGVCVGGTKMILCWFGNRTLTLHKKSRSLSKRSSSTWAAGPRWFIHSQKYLQVVPDVGITALSSTFCRH